MSSSSPANAAEISTIRQSIPPRLSRGELLAQLRGSIVALVTPMHDDGVVNFDALRALVEWHIEAGTNAIVAVGTTGESATLAMNEHIEVIRFVVEVAAGRVIVIGGTGANSTAEAIELSKRAQQAGVDACLLVTPYYNKPTQEGLYQHHMAVANATDVPQILYNVPGRTAVDMLPATIARLAEVDSIIAVKEATGDIQRGREVKAVIPDDFILLSGDDATFVELIKIGAAGNISVTANVAPAAMRAVCDAALAGDFSAANEHNQCLLALHTDLFVESNPIPVKWALHAMGKVGLGLRLPLTVLSADSQPVVTAALLQAGITLTGTE